MFMMGVCVCTLRGIIRGVMGLFVPYRVLQALCGVWVGCGCVRVICLLIENFCAGIIE